MRKGDEARDARRARENQARVVRKSHALQAHDEPEPNFLACEARAVEEQLF